MKYPLHNNNTDSLSPMHQKSGLRCLFKKPQCRRLQDNQMKLQTKFQSKLQFKLQTKHIHKYIGAASAMLAFLYFSAGIYIFASSCRLFALPVSAQQGIADKILRFHVIGSSDSADDQEVKLIIKDEIINYLKPYLSDISSKSDAESIILYHIDDIIETAQEKLCESGFNYSVSAALSQEYFPVKTYGDISLPAGTYDALVISLGEAGGQNWWCIMFPQLCFIDSSYSIVPDSSKEDLKYLLTEEEYEAVLSPPVKITYKSKLFEWLKKLSTAK